MGVRDDKPLNRTERFHHYHLSDAMRRLEWDLHNKLATEFRIPNEWHEISERRERKKTRIGFSVDEDVVKWFKSMGPGYQPRMNDVLRAFMHAKLMGLIRGDDARDLYDEGLMAGAEPVAWGSSEAMLDRGRARRAAREAEAAGTPRPEEIDWDEAERRTAELERQVAARRRARPG